MNDDENKPGLPKWWMDGTGPVAIGGGAVVLAAVMAWSRHGRSPAEGFGTLILISIIANLVAIDNSRDGSARRRWTIRNLAIGLLVATAVLGVLACR